MNANHTPSPDTASAATVERGAFLTLHYRLFGPAGDVVNTFGGPPATLSMGAGQLSPALEERLLGLREGERRTFDIPAGEAFGQRNPDMVQWLARRELDELGDPEATYTVGEVAEFVTPDGQGQFAGVVVEVRDVAMGGDGAVLFDFNHPLAGRAVGFEVHILAVL